MVVPRVCQEISASLTLGATTTTTTPSSINECTVSDVKVCDSSLVYLNPILCVISLLFLSLHLLSLLILHS